MILFRRRINENTTHFLLILNHVSKPNLEITRNFNA